MKELNLACKIRIKKYKSYKGEIGMRADNLLLDKVVYPNKNETKYVRNFKTTSSNEKWSTDITEFNINSTKIYLSPIIDLYDKSIISFSISKTPNMKLVMDMLNKALEDNEVHGLILHSNQGWQYQHKKYQDLLKARGINQSMSRKGNCLDNSIVENFFSQVKSEFYYINQFESVDDFIIKLTEYLNYYNNERLPLKLKGLTPIQYRNQSLKSSFIQF
jgi:putative transposase